MHHYDAVLKNFFYKKFSRVCCLLFNYQGSSLFLLIRSSFDILSRRFPFVKNFFIFFLLSVPEVFLPHKSALIGYHIRILLSRTFFTLSSDLLSHPVPQWPLGLFFSSVCLSDKWYLITGKVNCQCFFCFLFFSHNSDNSLFFLLTVSCCSYVVLYFAQYKTAAFKNSAHPDTSSS